MGETTRSLASVTMLHYPPCAALLKFTTTPFHTHFTGEETEVQRYKLVSASSRDLPPVHGTPTALSLGYRVLLLHSHHVPTQPSPHLRSIESSHLKNPLCILPGVLGGGGRGGRLLHREVIK